MKHIIIFLALLLSSQCLWAQGIAINDDGSAADSSAILDVKSTNKGVLIPRMTTTERIAIASAATGLTVFDNTTLSFWYYDGSQWLEFGEDQIIFSSEPGVVQLETDLVDETTADFVFGSTQLDDDGNPNHDMRLFFDKSEGAFRVGYVKGSQWDETNIGSYSISWGQDNIALNNNTFAWGQDNTASGEKSTVWGVENTASSENTTVWGEYSSASAENATSWGIYNDAIADGSTAWGYTNDASANRSTVWGRYNNATADRSTTWGYWNDATGFCSTTWGYRNLASGNTTTAFGEENITSGDYATTWGEENILAGYYATAFGDENITSGDYATAWGIDNTLSGDYATAWGKDNTLLGDRTTAWGDYNTALGDYATVWGALNEASSYLETTFGRYNRIDGLASATSWVDTDVLLSVGNGSVAGGRSNALTLYKNGTLNLNEAYSFPNYAGGNNFILVTDGNGNLSWVRQTDNLGDHTVTDNLQLGSSWLSGDGDNEGGYLASDGKLGINTNAPGHKLDVNGNAQGRNQLYFGTTGAFLDGINQGGSIELGPSQSSGGEIPFIDFHYGNGSSQDYNARIINNGNKQLTFETGTGTAMTVKGTNVGIGTTNPTNGKLEVTGLVYKNIGGVGTVTPGGGLITDAPSMISIYASDWIVGFRCAAHSDERIKTNRSLSDSKEDLSKLMDIKVTNYQFIDKLQYGDQFEKKVIAQELKEIYPQAVMNTISKVVPDVLKDGQAKNGWITLENHQLKLGETVRLVHANGAEEYPILETTTNAFKVDFKGEGKIFVYGRLVDDFHIVDYDAIAMLNVSATQEQQKTIEALQKDSKSLQASAVEFKEFKASTEERLQALEAVLLQQAQK